MPIDDSVEVEASFEQNYRVRPDDPYIMARMCMALRQRWYPQHGGSPESVFKELLSRCKTAVMSAIEEAQSGMKDEGFE